MLVLDRHSEEKMFSNLFIIIWLLNLTIQRFRLSKLIFKSYNSLELLARTKLQLKS